MVTRAMAVALDNSVASAPRAGPCSPASEAAARRLAKGIIGAPMADDETSKKPWHRAPGAVPWIAGGPLPAYQAPPPDLPEPVLDDGWLARGVPAHLAELALRQPAAMALADGEREYSFAELHTAARRIAAALRARDWPSGAVGVLLPNDARHIAGVLGCLAAGRPCMPLGPHSPAPFLASTIAAAGLVGVVTMQPLAASLPAGLPVLDFDTEGPPDMAPPRSSDGADTAPLIFSTSGSTGLPKAMARGQAEAVLNAYPRILALRLGPHDRVAVTGAAGTSGALSQWVTALVAGAGVVVVDVHRRGLGAALEQIKACGVTVLHATPQLLKTLAGLPAAQAALSGLRVAMLGGDAIMCADLDVIRAGIPPNCRINVALALTEVGRVAHWFVPPDAAHDPVRVGVGYLAEGVEALVIDEAGHPVPPGEPGELVVRTRVSAVGDWIAGRLVPARFPTDPTDPTRRIFHTGDIVRIARDGVLVMLGRRDRMVKLAGQRVEPAVIEAAMRTVPGVADSAVVALRDGQRVRLAGFVVSNAAPDEGEIQTADPLLAKVRAALRQAVPAAMVPALLRRIAAIPRTPAGKRDDAALVALAMPPDAP